MTDAPERILVGRFNGSLIIDSKGERLTGMDTHVEYVRADLAPSPDVEAAYARGFHDAQHKAKLEGRLVLVDSPEIRALVGAVRPFSQMAIRDGAHVVCDVTPAQVLRLRAAIAAYEKERKGE